MSANPGRLTSALVIAAVVLVTVAGAIWFVSRSPDQEAGALPHGVGLTLVKEPGTYTVADSIPVRAFVVSTVNESTSVSWDGITQLDLVIKAGGTEKTLSFSQLISQTNAGDLLLPPRGTVQLFEIMLPMGLVPCAPEAPMEVQIHASSRDGNALASTSFLVHPAAQPFIRVVSDKMLYALHEEVALRFYLCNPRDNVLTVTAPSTPGWTFSVFDSDGFNLTLWTPIGYLTAPQNYCVSPRTEAPLPLPMLDTGAFEMSRDVERIQSCGTELIGSEFRWSQFSTLQGDFVGTGVFTVRAKIFGPSPGTSQVDGMTVIRIVSR